MMKLAIIATVAILATTPAFADDWDFMLINNSGKSIKNVELAPTGTTTWQANRVDPEIQRDPVIKAAGRTTVHFDKGATCKYDIKATFVDDSSSTWTGINLCDNSYVTLRYNAAGKPTFAAN